MKIGQTRHSQKYFKVTGYWVKDIYFPVWKLHENSDLNYKCQQTCHKIIIKALEALKLFAVVVLD